MPDLDLNQLAADIKHWGRELGFDEALNDGICLVEWPEKAQGMMPTPDADLSLQPMDDHDTSRRFTFMARTLLGQQLLEAVRP